MNLPQRTTFSLLISVILFIAFSLLAFTGLFDRVEVRFYYPQLAKSLDREVEQLARTIDTLLTGLQDRFAETLEDDAVKRSFLPSRKEDDVLGRAERYDFLMNSLPGLRAVRFVDAGGRIYFSTLKDDLLSQTGPFPAYRSYLDCPGVLPYGELETAMGQKGRIIFDGAGEQLIFSYPFSDSLDMYRGSAFFTLSARTVTEYLIRQGQLMIGENVVVVDSPGGFLLGPPAVETGNFKPEAAAVWQENILTLYNTNPSGAEPLMLVSAKSGAGFFVGRLVREDLLILPPVMQFVLLCAFFLTVFLLIFLLFSLKQDNLAVIQARLKRLQSSLIRQYYDNKGDIDWKRWGRELERRREDVRLELNRGLPRTSKDKKESDALIDRSWDELTAAISGLPPAGFDEGKNRSPAGKAPQDTGPGGVSEPAESEILEELEVVETPEESEGPLRAEEMEETDGIEEIVEDGPSAREIVITPAVFATGDMEETAELEPLRDPADGPMSREDLDTLASQIEFGSAAETPETSESPAGAASLKLNLFSPFDTLTFETPDFSGFEEVEKNSPRAWQEAEGIAKKKHQYEAGGNSAGGLEDISADGGQPLIYRPFLFRENGKPFILRPLAEPGGEPIQEQDGIHLINSDILDPSLETSQTLDPKFLRLVESIIGRERVPHK